MYFINIKLIGLSSNITNIKISIVKNDTVPILSSCYGRGVVNGISDIFLLHYKHIYYDKKYNIVNYSSRDNVANYEFILISHDKSSFNTGNKFIMTYYNFDNKDKTEYHITIIPENEPGIIDNDNVIKLGPTIIDGYNVTVKNNCCNFIIKNQ